MGMVNWYFRSYYYLGFFQNRSEVGHLEILCIPDHLYFWQLQFYLQLTVTEVTIARRWDRQWKD